MLIIFLFAYLKKDVNLQEELKKDFIFGFIPGILA